MPLLSLRAAAHRKLTQTQKIDYRVRSACHLYHESKLAVMAKDLLKIKEIDQEDFTYIKGIIRKGGPAFGQDLVNASEFCLRKLLKRHPAYATTAKAVSRIISQIIELEHLKAR